MKENDIHKRKSGFKVPKDYFENFEDELSKNTEFYASKSDSYLSNIKSDSGFRVPKEYFTDVEKNILKKTDSGVTKGKLINLRTNKRAIIYVSGIAAMIAILFSLNINYKSTQNINDIDVAELYGYLTEETLVLNEEDILSLFDDNITYSEVFVDDMTTNEELMNYLSEEELEDELIFTE
ncbi:hypothetical protein [Aquimarina pacifica]|uniref:hypothetical protein n=1 Tax=Aquimarina pacifica TaxID=1296415 RepID=UPI0004715BDC|nr:hypothetical protein [Aquimarina pacifica]